MKILRRLLWKKYCYNCYEVKYYRDRLFGTNNQLSLLKSDYKRLLKILNNIDESQNAIYFNMNSDMIELVTVSQIIDRGKIIELEFYGFFDSIKSFNTYKSQKMFVDVCTNKNNDVYFYIVDIQCQPNKGYGSIMMEQFLKYIRKFNAISVTGWLSPVDTKDKNDKEHNDRLHHFYKKFGFDIYFNSKGDEMIKLNLSEYYKNHK